MCMATESSPLTPLLWVHSRTGCARGGLWWSWGWGIWRSPPQTYSPSYPACWQISTQLLSEGPKGRRTERTGEQWNTSHNILTQPPGPGCRLIMWLWDNLLFARQAFNVCDETRLVLRSFVVFVQSRVFYLVSQHPVELLFRNGQPLSVCTVHHQDDELQIIIGGEIHTEQPFLKSFIAMHWNVVGGSFLAKDLAMALSHCWWPLC